MCLGFRAFRGLGCLGFRSMVADLGCLGFRVFRV